MATIDEACSNAGNYQVIGNIAITKMYHNKALANTEVLQNFNALRERYGI